MKLPPIEKIYEAWSALADGRVKRAGDRWEINSSDGSKKYTVKHSNGKYLSNDSATYWQGYPGYPVLAVMMAGGELPYDEQTALNFRSVNWNALNKRYDRNYTAAVAEVLSGLKAKGIDSDSIVGEAARTYELLRHNPPSVGRLTKGK